MPLPTANVVLLPTHPPEVQLAPASTPDALAAPVYQVAPEPVLAATASMLMDTPVLEPSPEPTPAPVPAPAPLFAVAPAPLVAPVVPVIEEQRAVTRIVIDAIQLDRTPLVVGTDAQGVPYVPKHDIGWFDQSAAPGEGENVVLWGHALRFRDAPDVPAPFGQLSQLHPGDQITLHDNRGGAHVYRVMQQVWATPDQVSFILPTGAERLTLVSCIGDRVVTERGVTMTHRLITIAEPTAR
jgi:LPXTG-site transpeptidase (sortase) family protein